MESRDGQCGLPPLGLSLSLDLFLVQLLNQRHLVHFLIGEETKYVEVN